MKLLREKERNDRSVSHHLFVILKMDDLEEEFDLRICTDSEQYFENLVKRKKSIQKKERKNYRRYLIITCDRWRRPLRF